jgi:hypothetical protein
LDGQDGHPLGLPFPLALVSTCQINKDDRIISIYEQIRFSPGRTAEGIFKVSGSEIRDDSGNVFLTLENNLINLFCYFLTLMKNLLILWRLYIPLATDQLGGAITTPPGSR